MIGNDVLLLMNCTKELLHKMLQTNHILKIFIDSAWDTVSVLASGVSLTCEARNNNISAPLTRSLKIEMIYPPVDVSITSIGEPLSVGKEYTVECEAAGSRFRR